MFRRTAVFIVEDGLIGFDFRRRYNHVAGGFTALRIVGRHGGSKPLIFAWLGFCRLWSSARAMLQQEPRRHSPVGP